MKIEKIRYLPKINVHQKSSKNYEKLIKSRSSKPIKVDENKILLLNANHFRQNNYLIQENKSKAESIFQQFKIGAKFKLLIYLLILCTTSGTRYAAKK